MEVREPKYSEIAACASLVHENWGRKAAERCEAQMIEYFRGGKYAPTFVVADNGFGVVVGFAAFAPTMLMTDLYDLIWLVVEKGYQKHGVGRILTEWRLSGIKRLGGAAVQLVTQKPDYFARWFGFAPLAPLGNGWTLMLKRLKNVEMGR
jgi:N-acetylglutamate synthase-like GNAT family acetyltransferase